MSRSRKKVPVVGYTNADSDKLGKVEANRRYRKIVKSKLDVRFIDKDTFLDFPSKREVTNVWDFPKDGKQWVVRNKEKALRK